MKTPLSSDQRQYEVSTMNTRIMQLVKEVIQAQSDREELRKRVWKILNRRKHKDEDDDDPE
jgi:hypothetical protein